MKVTILEHYQNTLELSLEKLKASNIPLSKQEVIEILLTRDAIHKALSNKIKPSADAILKIEALWLCCMNVAIANSPSRGMSLELDLVTFGLTILYHAIEYSTLYE